LADPFELSRAVLDDARAGRPGGEARAALAALDPEALADLLNDDQSRIAFWLNIYNGVVRGRIHADPASYLRRWRFFGKSTVVVAGRHLSLNAIEHGILRRSAFLVSLGYLRNPFPSAFERRMRVRRVDPRIHFALNCGARSCPPLWAWSRETLDGDLDRATEAYLTSESRLEEDGRQVRVPRLLLWYLGDFGGLNGVRSLLQRHRVIGPDAHPRLRFGPYDWTLEAIPPARTAPMDSGGNPREAQV